MVCINRYMELIAMLYFQIMPSFFLILWIMMLITLFCIFVTSVTEKEEDLQNIKANKENVMNNGKEIKTVENGAKKIVDSKGYLTNRTDLEDKGYPVKTVSLEKDKFSRFDPYKALIELAEEDPVKFKRVLNELEDIIKTEEGILNEDGFVSNRQR